MNRIQKVSAFFSIVFQFLLYYLPLHTVFKWIFINADFMGSMFAWIIFVPAFNGPEGEVFFRDVEWTPLTKFIGLSADLLALLPIIISLFALIRIFKHYQQGEIFNNSNARYYRLMGWMFIFDGLIAKSFSQSLMTLAVTLNNSSGHRYITFGIHSANFEALFCGAVIIVISWVMLEASKLHDEQKFTV
jgi:hypothetical protein